MRRIILPVALLFTSLASARSLEELERDLQRTPPVTTGFIEYRFSHLLKTPLRSSGTLEYRADGTLARSVESPQRETTEVSGDRVRITREDRPVRTLSLARAPQLRVLLGSFRALLEGHLAPLGQDFDVTLGDEPAQWTLTLKPRQPGVAKHVASIEVFGSGNRLDCVQALEPDGDSTITLLSESTRSLAPTAVTTKSRVELEGICRGTVARVKAETP